MKSDLIRNFLYLDTGLVDNYLSSVEGTRSSGIVKRTNQAAKNGRGPIGTRYTYIEESASRTNSEQNQLPQSDAGKFQRLYEDLSDEATYVNRFDDKFFDRAHVGMIVEMPSSLMYPDIIQAGLGIQRLDKTLSALMAFRELFSGHLEEYHPDGNVAVLQQAQALKVFAESTEVPIAFFPVDSDEYEMVADLKRRYITARPEELQTDAVVFGKVRKVIDRGDEEPIYSGNYGTEMFLNMTSTEGMTRREQRKMQRSFKNKIQTLDAVEGPGLRIVPIAIWT